MDENKFSFESALEELKGIVEALEAGRGIP